MKRSIIAVLIFTLFLSSCLKESSKFTFPSSNLEKYKGYKPILGEENPLGDEKKERVVEEMFFSPQIEGEKKIPDEEIFDPESLKLPEEKVFIKADNVPLFEFLLYIFGEVLKVPLVVNEEVRNLTLPITLIIPEPIAPKEALQIVIEILKKNNLRVYTKNGAIFVLKPKPQPSLPPKSVSVGSEVSSTSSQIMHIISLKYAKASDIGSLISDFYKGTVTVKVIPKDNAIALIGQGWQIKNIMEFIKTIDVPNFGNKKILLFKLFYWRSEDFINQLSEILISLGIPVAKSHNEPGVILIPIRYLNSILIVTADESIKELVTTWINKLDSPESAGGEERIFTYQPLYVRASELVDTVSKLLTGHTPQPISSEKTTLFQTPPLPSQKSQPSPATSIQKSTFDAQETKFLPPQRDKSAIRQFFSLENIKITADDKRNTVVIICPPTTYKFLLELFREIDKPPRQVLIETVIAEITLKDELKYGVEWYLRNTLSGEQYTIQTLDKLGVSTTGGLVFYFVTSSEKFKLLMNFLAQKNLIRILSTPRLLVLDNEAASINVGMDVPIVTGEQTT
ncbi:MAG: hypothetical protein NC925_01775, partial [Candidatus Omnitrophica bacterium]|nr:hypothetical protein [Candidatus Omnitrophota bacterium]